MKKLFAVSALLFALFVPVLAQAQRQLSPEDQRRFDSYYSRWQEYRHTNNREQIASMEKRMQDVYAHYGIPAGRPTGEWRRTQGESGTATTTSGGVGEIAGRGVCQPTIRAALIATIRAGKNTGEVIIGTKPSAWKSAWGTSMPTTAFRLTLPIGK